MIQKTTYYASFGVLGYYAKYQPHYEWSFTFDLDKALEYKTINGALDRIFGMGIEVNQNRSIYTGNDRCLVEKKSNIITNDNNTSITFSIINKSFEDSVKLYQTKETLKYKKRDERRTAQQQVDDINLEKERIKWEIIIKERLEKQENFYKPKCIELQNLLNNSEYIEKRNTLILNNVNEKEIISFYELNNNTHYSKYFSLLKFYTTIKILFDNNQQFSIIDFKIKIKTSDMENIRSLFMNNGVFKDNYCKFGKEKELFTY